MTTLKGLPARIFRCAQNKDHNFSNGGISSRVDEVTILDVGGVHEVSPEAPAVRIVTRTVGNRPCPYAVPLLSDEDIERIKKNKMVGPMFGGTYIATSDSRLSDATGLYAAIPLHDRWETQH